MDSFGDIDMLIYKIQLFSYAFIILFTELSGFIVQFRAQEFGV